MIFPHGACCDGYTIYDPSGELRRQIYCAGSDLALNHTGFGQVRGIYSTRINADFSVPLYQPATRTRRKCLEISYPRAR